MRDAREERGTGRVAKEAYYNKNYNLKVGGVR